ncbi:MAG TPA: helix-turn-helix transcriptional regulator [Burkholderiales bacterium]
MPRPAIKQRAFLDRRLRAIDEYLRAHLSEPSRLTLAEAARIANVSPEHLCRLFSHRVGACFTDWQCAVRTERAKRMIVEQSVQLRAVGRAVGYGHQATFVKVFKRYEGVAPGAIRRFVESYPELAPAVCCCTAAFVFAIGPLCLVNAEVRALLLELVQRLASDRQGATPWGLRSSSCKGALTRARIE